MNKLVRKILRMDRIRKTLKRKENTSEREN